MRIKEQKTRVTFHEHVDDDDDDDIKIYMEILMGYFNGCNFNRHDLMRSLMIV